MQKKLYNTEQSAVIWSLDIYTHENTNYKEYLNPSQNKEIKKKNVYKLSYILVKSNIKFLSHHGKNSLNIIL